MIKNILIGLAAILVIGYFGYGAFEAYRSEKPAKILPYYGPIGKDSVAKDSTSADYYKIPDFSFLDQDSQVVNKAGLRGKIFISDFFFTTCQGICPAMTHQMDRLAKAYQDDNEIWFLSHTVNPEYDTVGVLRSYAESKGVSNSNWRFLTGTKKALYKMAREGYFIDYNQGKGRDENFVHTENFVLVDKEGHIRGYYDGTDSTSINDLMKDIKLLKAQYLYQAH